MQVFLGSELKSKNHPIFLQLMGEEGSGVHRLALSLLKQEYPKIQTALWIQPQWNLYAPSLWKSADEEGIRLAGLECAERRRLRPLFRELFDTQVFDAWILDGFHLHSADGLFLHQLLKNTSQKVVILDARPHAFCQRRAHIHLCHDRYRILWTKGGPLTPHYQPASFWQWISTPCTP